jgi:hypothetical protein
MISYETAKQLKDAGFPQFTELQLKEAEKYRGTNPDYIRYPTLSELIAECGDYFVNLERLPGMWVTNIGKVTGDDKDTYQTDGDTPEEAVASLWLAIKKNATPHV